MVGLRREQRTIATDEFTVTEVVDGQQRLTTLIILLKALEKVLARNADGHISTLANNIQALLIKQDDVSLILLRVNHDTSEIFSRYLRTGNVPNVRQTKTLADKNLVDAISECEASSRLGRTVPNYSPSSKTG